MCKILSNIWANSMHFNHANTLSNGMPIYGQSVQLVNYGQVWLQKYCHAHEHLTIYFSIMGKLHYKVSNAGSN